MTTYTIHHGDCLDILRTIPDGSIDAVITDPPYPMIKRDYGMLTEAEWWELMMGVCTEVRRVLKPTGSAVFILQPNSRKVGSMRGWLWEFMAWVCREWNMVQDAYWNNTAALSTGDGFNQNMLKAAIKACVWAGASNCYRNRTNVMLAPRQKIRRNESDELVYRPSGIQVRRSNFAKSIEANGGVVPVNVLEFGNGGSHNSGAYGHGAGTPLKLADWWTRYIVPPGGTVLDCFNGAGTMGVAALQNGAHYIGIEKMQKYVDVTHERLAKVQPALMEASA